MKIDRFVKVMLVLTALLLAFNCAKAINLTSNSSGSSNNPSSNSGRSNEIVSSKNSSDSSSPSIFENSVEAQSKPTPLQVGKTQYKVVAIQVNKLENPNVVQLALNQQSADGWEYVNTSDGVLIFKK